MWGALRGVVNSVCNAGRDPFVSVADVLGIVVSATWRGTGCLVEPNCHGGARYCLGRTPRSTCCSVPRARRACDTGLAGGYGKGLAERHVASCVSQVLTCVTCMVRPR